MLLIQEIGEQNKLIARQLLAEYGTLLFDELKLMAGNDTFFNELKMFPDKKYQKPDGAFYVAYEDHQAVGCAGIKRLDNESCELKRMFIRPEFRGRGYGFKLTNFLIERAGELGFKRILLDTNLEMPAAVATYKKSGFMEIPAYCENDNLHPVFMEYQL